MYADNESKNQQTGEVTFTPVTNEWVLSHKPNRVLLELSKVQIINDDTDISILTVTLRTPELIDGTFDTIDSGETIQIQIDDDPDYLDVILTNGIGTLNLTSDTIGGFVIQCQTYTSNQAILEVI